MKKSAFLLLTCAGLVTACSKNNNGSGNGGNNGNPGGASGSTDQIKQITLITPISGRNDTSIQQFEYDAQGRCTQYTQNNSTTPVTTYSYGTGTMTSDGGGFETKYFLNASGNADSAYLAPFGSTVTLPPASGTYIFRYFYNGSGYLIKQQQLQVNDDGSISELESDLFTISGGNITVVTDSANQASTPLTYTNQTTTTQPLPPDPVLGAALSFLNAGPSVALFGKGNTNLLADFPESIGNTTTNIKLTYQLDSQGRISKTTEDTPEGASGPASVYYTYY